MSNCLDCDDAFDVWGAPVVPHSPDGWYRHLWQLQDHFGCHRFYPAYSMECAGIKQRGDHWAPAEFKALSLAMTDGVPWWFKQGLFIDAMKTPNQVVLDVAVAVGFPDNAQLYVWWQAYDPGYPSRRSIWLWTGAWNGFRGWRLRDLATWVYPAAPPAQDLSEGPIFAVVRPLSFGDILIGGF